MTIDFGFVATAAGAPDTPDVPMYRDLIADCEYYADLGFSTAWLIEHHFSDYFPTPDPLGLLQFIAGRVPDLHLGTCVVVTPWHHPLRLAEQIAQLNALTDRELHLGLGRGTAKFEYDAFGLRMEEARERFAEILDIIRLGLAGQPFTYAGTHHQVAKEIVLRPVTDPSKVHFYGAIGNPASAPLMARMGLPPMCTTVGDYDQQRKTLLDWDAAAKAANQPTGGKRPIMINCIVADTDAEAIAQAQRYIPAFMKAQVDHYTIDDTPWEDIKGYEAWRRIFSGMKARMDPANIPPWTQWQLIGSPDTVAQRLRNYLDVGFDTFLLHTATPGVPAAPRREWTRRFARDVMPAFQSPSVTA